MIPAFIARSHILTALRRIQREGVPGRRQSRDYCLVENGHHYPPKYAVAIAHEVATGTPVQVRFFGGAQTNGFLANRGFTTIACGCGGTSALTPRPALPERPDARARRQTPDAERRSTAAYADRPVLIDSDAVGSTRYNVAIGQIGCVGCLGVLLLSLAIAMPYLGIPVGVIALLYWLGNKREGPEDDGLEPPA